MSAELIVGLPSKGRLREPIETWLERCGLSLDVIGGDRGYSARLRGLAEAEVRLLSASEIASGLEAGELHVGVTGDDLLHERADDDTQRTHPLHGLGVGRADLIVAAPRAWIDVTHMADLADLASRERAQRGRRLRVATKYLRSTRRFFAAHGVVDYHIVESGGATEGAPASGQADLIVDITSTGRTLAANHLKILEDGLILRSQARLTASLSADWSAEARAGLKRWLDVVQARDVGAGLVHIRAEAPSSVYGDLATRFDMRPDADGRGGLCPRKHLTDACAALREHTPRDIVVSSVEYVFTPTNVMYERFIEQISYTEQDLTD